MIKNGRNDFDIWSNIVNKMDLTEAVAPVVRGRVLLDESEVETYNKIQKLLNSTGMESSHRFLYSLDPSDLTESEINKVNNLYKLGQERGFIEADKDENADESEEDGKNAEKLVATECDNGCSIMPSSSVSDISKPMPLQKNAFTVIYSATRDGTIKTGEAYSNCINTCSAKADVISKLEKAGYQNISILAIEAGDPDSVGCNNTYYKLPEVISYPATSAIPDYSVEDEDVDEADDSDPTSHALDPIGVKASSATLRTNNVAQMSEIFDNENDEEEQLDEDGEEDKENDSSSEESKEDKEKEKDSSKEDDEKEGDAGDSKDDKSDNDDKGDEEEKEEDPEEPDEKLKDDAESDEESADDDEDKELSADEKEKLKDSYKKAFKAALQKCKFTTSFSELSLEQKVEFFTELSKAWGDKADPSKFMSDKEVDQLEKIVVKKQ